VEERDDGSSRGPRRPELKLVRKL